MNYICTDHAVQRYNLHYPQSTKSQVIQEVAYSKEIGDDLANSLLARKQKDDDKTIFMLQKENAGLFVIDGNVIVTYLRFSLVQRKFVDKWFGEKKREFDAKIEEELLLDNIFSDPDSIELKIDHRLVMIAGGYKKTKIKMKNAPVHSWKSLGDYTVKIETSKGTKEVNLTCNNLGAKMRYVKAVLCDNF